MPDSPSYLLLLSAIFELLMGLGLLLAPDSTLRRVFLPNATPGPDALVAARVAGAGLTSLGVLALMTFDATEPAILKPVLMTMALYMGLATVNRLLLAASLAANSHGGKAPGRKAAHASAAIHGLLSAGLLYYWWRLL
jgi:hypothetical protein